MAKRILFASVFVFLLLHVTVNLAGQPPAQFSYRPVGELAPGSGTGRSDPRVYAPRMSFPIETSPAFANSQMWGVGGQQGPPGNECSAQNFAYPWRDNFCESRTYSVPLCPSGTGHQGQDVRAASCKKDVHWVVAAADATVTNIGPYSVYLTLEILSG